jgi:hypothetical protein
MERMAGSADIRTISIISQRGKVTMRASDASCGCNESGALANTSGGQESASSAHSKSSTDVRAEWHRGVCRIRNTITGRVVLWIWARFNREMACYFLTFS